MKLRVATPIIAIILCGLLYLSGVTSVISEATLDAFFQLRGERETSQKIVIIGIDESSLKALGPWPFSRKTHAELLPHLHKSKVITFDLLFIDSTADDDIFNKSIEGGPPVIFATAHDYNRRVSRSAPALQNQFGSGSIETQSGKNGIVRKMYSQNFTTLMPLSSIILQAANQQHVLPGKNHYINFYGPEFTFLYIPYLDVINEKYPPDFFTNRFIFVGAQALGLGDVHMTPFSSNHPTPGVEIQATILNNVLDSSFLELNLIAIFMIVSLILLLTQIWPNLPDIYVFLFIIFFLVFLLAGSFYCFLLNTFIDPTIPIVLLFTTYLSHLVSQGLWLTKTLIQKIDILDKQLQSGVQELYTNVPTEGYSQSTTIKKPQILESLRRHISNLETGVQAIGLQNHFVNHLLKKETPPLIIWNKTSSEVAIANKTSIELWKRLPAKNKEIPNFHDFLSFIKDHQLKDHPPFSPSDIISLSNKLSMTVDIEIADYIKPLHFHITLQSLDPTGSGFPGYMASFTEVTEIRHLERVKGEVLSIVSHELKLPLTTILGYGEMLADTLPVTQAKYAEEICTHTKHLNRLIEEFLSIERIESGKQIIDHFPFDLLTIVEDGINSVSHIASLKEIDIQLDAPIKISHLTGDETLLLQAYINLLDNAIKFSPNGTVVLTVISESLESISIEVKDQGPGISQKNIRNIFNKFTRDTAHQDISKGFGLGLAFVKQAAKSHHGTIRVTSTDNNGASFLLTLPKNIQH